MLSAELLWHVWGHANGKCAVPADGYTEALAKLQANQWNGKYPAGWVYEGTMLKPRPPWSAWDRLAAWSGDDRSKV